MIRDVQCKKTQVICDVDHNTSRQDPGACWTKLAVSFRNQTSASPQRTLHMSQSLLGIYSSWKMWELSKTNWQPPVLKNSAHIVTSLSDFDILTRTFSYMNDCKSLVWDSTDKRSTGLKPKLSDLVGIISSISFCNSSPKQIESSIESQPDQMVSIILVILYKIEPSPHTHWSIW